jgi:hypothetical protein
VNNKIYSSNQPEKYLENIFNKLVDSFWEQINCTFIIFQNHMFDCYIMVVMGKVTRCTLAHLWAILHELIKVCTECLMITDAWDAIKDWKLLWAYYVCLNKNEWNGESFPSMVQHCYNRKKIFIMPGLQEQCDVICVHYSWLYKFWNCYGITLHCFLHYFYAWQNGPYQHSNK